MLEHLSSNKDIQTKVILKMQQEYHYNISSYPNIYQAAQSRKCKKSDTDKYDEIYEIVKNETISKTTIHGGYHQPKLTELLFIDIIFYPKYIYDYIKWNINWIHNYIINKQEYSIEDKMY